MSGAFFVSRGELLAWLNDFLSLNYTRVEQVADAAAACQVFDALFPGKVPLHKVKFGARHEYEYVQNFKVLQAVLDRVGVDKTLEVERLVKARTQDNLEFLQWVKAMFDKYASGATYAAVERRQEAMRRYAETKGGRGVPATSPRAPRVPRPVSSEGSRRPAAGAAAGARIPPKPPSIAANKENMGSGAMRSAAPAPTAAPAPKMSAPAAPASPASTTDTVMAASYQELVDQMTELQLTIDNLEKERTYYFEKLRDIEVLCQTHPDQEQPFLKTVQAVLYDEPLAMPPEPTTDAVHTPAPPKDSAAVSAGSSSPGARDSTPDLNAEIDAAMRSLPPDPGHASLSEILS